MDIECIMKHLRMAVIMASTRPCYYELYHHIKCFYGLPFKFYRKTRVAPYFEFFRFQSAVSILFLYVTDTCYTSSIATRFAKAFESPSLMKVV